MVTYRHGDGICKRSDAHSDGANFPGQLDATSLSSLGEKEVKEEACAKDGGDCDAHKDVEGEDANNIIVLDVEAGSGLNTILLIDVVWTTRNVVSAWRQGNAPGEKETYQTAPRCRRILRRP